MLYEQKARHNGDKTIKKTLDNIVKINHARLIWVHDIVIGNFLLNDQERVKPELAMEFKHNSRQSTNLCQISEKS